ncbi:MAG: hypothetical protein ABWX65_11740 [Mycetocola sp.]
MSDPLDHNDNAPDDALLGPGSTATGGGTSGGIEAEIDDDTDTDTQVKPLDADTTDSTQLADDRFKHPDL